MARDRAAQIEALALARAIGANIRHARVLQGLSQKQLAERMGIGVQRVSEAERGIYVMGVERVGRFATALNVPINQLLTGEPPQT